MAQKRRDGISVNPTIYMTDGKSMEFPLLLRAIQGLVIMLGPYLFISILVECFRLPIYNGYLLLFAFLTGFIMFVTLLIPTYDIIKLVIGFLVYISVVYKLFSWIENGFYHIENGVLQLYSYYYDAPLLQYVADYETTERDVTMILIMFMILILLLLGVSIIRCRLLWLTLLVFATPVVASFAFGVTPSELHLISWLLCTIILFRGYYYNKLHSYKRKNFMSQRIFTRAAFYLAIAAIFLFTVMKLLLPEGNYHNINKIPELKLSLQRGMEDVSLDKFADMFQEIKWGKSSVSISTGGLNQGKLGRTGEIIYDGTEHLLVTLPYKAAQEGVYLRGFVGVNYEGDRWSNHSDSNKAKYTQLTNGLKNTSYNPFNGRSEFLQELHRRYKANRNDSVSNFSDSYEFNVGTLTVKVIEASKNYVYTPITTDFDTLAGVTFESDLYLNSIYRASEYAYPFYYSIEYNGDFDEEIKKLNTLADYLEYENQYQRFVKNAYTKLPKEGLESFKNEFMTEEVEKETDTLMGAIEFTKNYLNDNTQYSLNPGKTPKDKDYVEHFLFENKIGFCVHYATAATLMLRSMGYPARYVEGYVVTEEDVVELARNITVVGESYASYGVNKATDQEATISVKDYKAHAWVEVYVDGLGWYPVEVTPAAGVSNTVEQINETRVISNALEGKKELEEITPIPSQEPTVTNEPTEEVTKEPTVEPTKEPSDTKDQKENTSNQDEKKSGSGVGEVENKKPRVVLAQWVKQLIRITLLLGLLLGTCMLRKYLIRRKVNSRSKRAIYYYKNLEKLLARSGVLMKSHRPMEENLSWIKETDLISESEEFDQFMDVIWKARFGHSDIVYEEYKKIVVFAGKIRQKVLVSLPFYKKWWIRTMEILF